LINENQLLGRRFEWQRSYAVFSYSKSQIPAVKRYIANQKQHHAAMTFREEMVGLFSKYGIVAHPEFGFEWLELA
jgi:hypothetical protein